MSSRRLVGPNRLGAKAVLLEQGLQIGTIHHAQQFAPAPAEAAHRSHRGKSYRRWHSRTYPCGHWLARESSPLEPEQLRFDQLLRCGATTTIDRDIFSGAVLASPHDRAEPMGDDHGRPPLQDLTPVLGEVALHLGIERSGRRVERRACAGRGRKRAGNTRTSDLAAGNSMARSYWQSDVELLRAEIIEAAKRVPHTVPPTCKAHGRRWRTPSVFPGGDPD